MRFPIGSRRWWVGCSLVVVGCGGSDALPTGPDEPQSTAPAVEAGNDGGETPSGPAILVDASRDGGVWWFPQPSETGDFDPELDHQGMALAEHLRSLGYRVDELPRPYRITIALLEPYDVVVRANAFSGYRTDEVAAYEEYVEGGGALLLLNDHMRYAAPDAVGAAFGIVFQGITRGSQRFDALAEHPISEGVESLAYGVGSAIVEAPESAAIVGRLTPDGFADLDFDEVLGPGDVQAPAVLGAVQHGRGRIVFSGDTNMWAWVPQPLVDNVLEWLEGP